MKKKLLYFLFITTNLMSQNADIDLLSKINVNRNKGLDNTFKGISNTVLPFAIIAPASTFCVGIAKHDSTIKNKAYVIGASLFVSTCISAGLKYGTNRTRPYNAYSNIDNITSPSSPSFPSGHTSTAFATATSLSIVFPKWYVIAPSYLWACSVGYSRMHLGVHYPSDVLAGAIFGAGSTYLCYRANKWLNKRKKK